MKKLILYFSLFLFLLSAGFSQAYVPNKLVFKIKADFRHKCAKAAIDIPEIQQILQNAVSLQKKFPKHQAPAKSTKKGVDLSTIYELNLKPGSSIEKTINLLLKSSYVTYAEPIYENFLCYVPNDSSNSRQYYLQAINAFQAWDVEQGDSSITIAIVDTGTDLDHPDLVNQLALNTADPINGLDDDNDGYIDNYYGWNCASNNNNVSFENSGHGTNVAGIACAETDNLIGISGVGFKTKFLTVRIDLPSGVLRNAYDGIIYAADQGADIINCSWGSNGYSDLGQDIINYATYNKGALIVAGAGNFGTETPFYPAAFENVIAVGSTIEGDTVKAQSNYGHYLKLFAPGDNILTTNVIGGLGVNGGTSMASPIVAGCAALLKAKYPSYNAQQISQQLYNTADNIEALAPAKYAGKMGYGRVNIFRALTESIQPGLDFIQVSIEGEESKTFSAGDTMEIRGALVNYLAAASNVELRLLAKPNKYDLIQGSVSLGSINTLDTAFVQSNPLSIRIKSGLSFNESLELEFLIIATNYSNKSYRTVSINKDFITVSENKIRATYTSSGGIGYSGPFANLGEGISLMGSSSFLYEGGLAIGNSPFYLVDKFRNDQNGVDQDFQTINPIAVQVPKKANVELQTRFNDAAFSNPQGLEVTQRNYLFRAGDGERSIIYVYTLSNNGLIELQNLYAGLFMDWDIHNYAKNKITYDSSRKMGISFATDTNLFAGIKLLSKNLSANHYAMDNSDGVDPQISTSNGLSDTEKYHALSTSKNEAGNQSSAGNDVIDVLSAGPFNLKVDSSISISFLITLGDSLNQMKQEADSLQEIFNRLSLDLIEKKLSKSGNFNSRLYPNPSADILNFEFYLSSPEQVSFEVFDLMGNKVLSEKKKIYGTGSNKVSLDISSLKTAVYFLRLNGVNLKIENTFVKISN